MKTTGPARAVARAAVAESPSAVIQEHAQDPDQTLSLQSEHAASARLQSENKPSAGIRILGKARS